MLAGTRWRQIELPEPTTLCGRRRWLLPRTPGIYALFLGKRLLYVGRSRDLRSRVAAHVNSRRWNTAIRIRVALTPVDIEEREKRLIRRLSPPHNRDWNQNKRSMDGRYIDHQIFGSLA